MHSERAPFFLKLAAWGGVVFLHFPILIIAAYAFNTEDAAFSFPPQGLTPVFAAPPGVWLRRQWILGPMAGKPSAT